MSSSSPPAALPPNAYDDRRATVIGTVVFCLSWATAMVGARLYTRGVVIHQLGVDDYLCAVALLVTYGSGIAIAHMTKYGLGRHVYIMEPANVPLYLRDFYVSIVLYCSSLLFIKMTFLFQYYRVLAVQHMRKVYIGCMVVVGGWALSQVLVGIFTCNPVSGFWDSSIKAKCIPDIPQWYINAGGNIITDVVVFTLPLPVLWKLQLARPSRILLVGIFSLGFFTVVISIIRIRYLKLFEDFPWENVASSLWSIGELTSALTCACLPTLRPLVVRFVPGLASHVTRG
ncbi:0ec0b235-2f10-408a-9ebd-c29ad514edeb [Thermothielavioides terrestris]|uniref:0ec0b235-2f10-408a-9ebd-c29ad514edeb n=1 Tax=Thermothielavioides terrestris TaxID=2587410 RepID=A0A446BQ66_9PEZI|nr:0ec0b235-2f10-408a-9ebd-c29ad514edeb [Thermothielavioides terrestris]